MLDIKKIKENPDAVKAGLKAKEVDCDAVVDRILELDVQIRGLKTSTEGKTAQKNKLAKENGKLFGQKKGAEKQGKDTAELDAQIEANKAESIALDAAIADEAALLKELNAEYRDIDKATDVLSFPLGENGVYDINNDTGAQMLGDIVISLEKAMEQADLYGHSLQREVAFLTVHSMYHLLGYDHLDEGEMKRQMRTREEIIAGMIPGMSRN